MPTALYESTMTDSDYSGRPITPKRVPVGSREFLVKVELWQFSAKKSQKTKPNGRPSSANGDETSTINRKIKDKLHSRSASSNVPAGQWRSVICKLAEDGTQSNLSIYSEDNVLQKSVAIHTLTSTDIRATDKSLYFRPDVLGIHGPNYEPIYLAFPSLDARNTWLVLLRSYANPEVYGRLISPEHGGLYRMWRQIEMVVLQGKNIGLKSQMDDRPSPQTENPEGDDESTRVGQASNLSSIDANGTASKSFDGSDIVDHEIFCEIQLDGTLAGRTTTKRGGAGPEWFEQFGFHDLPSFGTLSVNIWRERKQSKTVFLGTVELSLSNFRRGEFVEGWWPVFAPGQNRIQAGEMRLRIRVDEEIILPSPAYRKVLGALEQRNYLDLLTELEQRMRIDYLSPHILSLAVARRRLLPDLAQLADREVNMLTGSTNTLFRGNTVLTKTMELTMNWYGKAFLDASIGPVIRRMYNERVEIEIDPIKNTFGGGQFNSTTSSTEKSSRRSVISDIDSSVKQLTYWCTELWSQIYLMRVECPVELRVLFQHIRTLVETRFGKSSSELPWQSVSAFCFLRLIVPGILHPHLFGLCPGMPSKGVQRSLTLVAKVMQSLANLKTTVQREEYMRGVNDFMEQNLPAMFDYLRAVSTVPDEYVLNNAHNEGAANVAIYTNLSGTDKIDRLHVVSSLRGRLENNEIIPTLHKDAIPLLPYLLDIPKHLAIITSAIVRNARMGGTGTSYTRAASAGKGASLVARPSSSQGDNGGEWDIARFSQLCFDVEAQALRAVATLAASQRYAVKQRTTSISSNTTGDGMAPITFAGSRTRKVSGDSTKMRTNGVSYNSPPATPNSYAIHNPSTTSLQTATLSPPRPTTHGSVNSSTSAMPRKSAMRPATAPGSTSVPAGTAALMGVATRINTGYPYASPAPQSGSRSQYYDASGSTLAAPPSALKRPSSARSYSDRGPVPPLPVPPSPFLVQAAAQPTTPTSPTSQAYDNQSSYMKMARPSSSGKGMEKGRSDDLSSDRKQNRPVSRKGRQPSITAVPSQQTNQVPESGARGGGIGMGLNPISQPLIRTLTGQLPAPIPLAPTLTNVEVKKSGWGKRTKTGSEAGSRSSKDNNGYDSQVSSEASGNPKKKRSFFGWLKGSSK